MALQDIVDVQISQQTASVSRVGFGVPLILTYHTKDPARVLEYTSAADMIAQGAPFDSTDMAYILANAAFSQNPKPSRVLIGRRLNPTIRTVELTPLSGFPINGDTYPLNLTAYSVTISRGGVTETFTHTTDATATVAEITADLETKINAGGVDVLATDGTTKLTIEAAASPGGAATAGEAFQISYDRALISGEDITPVAAGGTLAEEIANIKNVNDTWYGITGDWFGKTEITAVAAAIESDVKLHGAASADDNMYDSVVTTDVGSALQTAGYVRTFCFHHPEADQGIAAAYLGKNLPKDPGSITWKFKTLAGIPFEDYTAGEETVLAGKNIERYVRIAGNNLTCDGKTSGGEWIDVTRFIDFVRARLEENIFLRLKVLDKVPFTDQGIAIIENEVRGVMQLGISVGGIAADPAPVVTVPLAANVSSNDKANRLLPDVTFTFTLSGAIHETEVRGVVTV